MTPVDETIKVNVFYGPSSKMHEAYPIESLKSHISLLQLASRLDTARFTSNSNLLQFQEEALIVWPEEFFGVRDSFTNSLWRNILDTNIKQIYIANPPKLLVEQAKLLKLKVEEKTHNYKAVDLQSVNEVAVRLRETIVGQDQAIVSLSRCLTALMNSQKKPVVVMLYGPTGVGKTESAKVIAETLGGEVTRLQFSMLQTNSLAEYLYGSKINNRSFAADLLERKSNVVVFDEFDKTSVAFHSAFYQLFDEGLYVDKNYHVDMSNTLIVCTSNYQSPQDIRKHLGAPLSSRFSAFIPYQEIDQEAKEKIIAKKMQSLYVSYPEQLRQHIDIDAIKNKFMPVLVMGENVREITNHLEYIMADSILRQSQYASSDEGNN